VLLFYPVLVVFKRSKPQIGQSQFNYMGREYRSALSSLVSGSERRSGPQFYSRPIGKDRLPPSHQHGSPRTPLNVLFSGNWQNPLRRIKGARVYGWSPFNFFSQSLSPLRPPPISGRGSQHLWLVMPSQYPLAKFFHSASITYTNMNYCFTKTIKNFYVLVSGQRIWGQSL